MFAPAVWFFYQKKNTMGFGASIMASGIGLVTSCFNTIPNFFISTFKINMPPTWLQLTFGTGLIIIGFYIFRLQFVERYILNISGFNKDALVSNHYKSLKLDRLSFKEVVVNFRAFVEGKKEITENISDCLVEMIRSEVNTFKDISRGRKTAYTGIAPIPFIMIAGKAFQSGDLQDYYELIHGTNKYMKLKRGFLKKHPKLLLKTDLTDPQFALAKEIVLCIELKNKISDLDIAQFNCPTIRLSLKEHTNLAIKTKAQLYEYRKQIIDLFAKLHNEFPQIKKVHLVCASQSCLPFEIARSLNDTHHPIVISYHYQKENDGESTVNYPWGIIINGNHAGQFIRVEKVSEEYEFLQHSV